MKAPPEHDLRSIAIVHTILSHPLIANALTREGVALHMVAFLLSLCCKAHDVTRDEVIARATALAEATWGEANAALNAFPHYTADSEPHPEDSLRAHVLVAQHMMAPSFQVLAMDAGATLFHVATCFEVLEQAHMIPRRELLARIERLTQRTAHITERLRGLRVPKPVGIG